MAGRIPDTFIDELLARIDIAEMIGERLALKRSGSNYSGLCPFHGEKTPFVHGELNQAVLPLLWLWRARQCNPLFNGI